MARVTKPAAIRQDELLDIAQRLFLQRGYELTSIQEVIDAAGIAKGTFYHHYASKGELLEALVRRTVAQSMAVVATLLRDDSLPAVERLNSLFVSVGAWKTERRALLTEMHRALHAPSNALFLSRIRRESMDAFVPVVAGLVRQGVREGAFDTAFPDQAARILLDLGVTLGDHIAAALLADGPPAPTTESVEAAIAAYHDAVRRILGAPPGAIHLVDTAQVLVWFPSPERP